MKFYPEICSSLRNHFLIKMKEMVVELSIEHGMHVDWDWKHFSKYEEVWFVIKTQDNSHRFDTLEELKSALKNKAFL